jgi:ankyrin repeat protein
MPGVPTTRLHYPCSESPFRGDLNSALLLSNVAQLLLEYGADMNALRNDRSTPLHVAARLGRVEVVHLLLEHGANVGAENDHGKTASQVASEMGHEEIMKLLSEHGTK